MEEKKFCKFCGEQIDINSQICPKCGRQLEIIEVNNNTIQEPISIQEEKQLQPKNKKKIKLIITIIICIIVLGLIFGDTGSEGNNDNKNNENSNISENNQTQNTTKTSYSFDEKIEFDDLEITIGSNYTFTKINNKYSEHHQKEVIKIPITVKNISNDTHSLNMFYYDIFGASGTEIETIWAYFDDSIESAGDLRTGASYTKYMYILYDGDGTYAIEFDNIWDEVTVELEIKK